MLMQPLKRSRVSSAAESSPSPVTNTNQAQSLQQLMTASNFSSQCSSTYMLQGLAEQGQACVEAIQQRAASWAVQRAQTPPQGQRLPSERGSLLGSIGSTEQHRAYNIHLELERRQQQAGVPMPACSPQASSHSVSHRDTSVPGMLRSSSANLDHSCNPRDPRQDPRGMKRVFTVSTMSTSPVKRLSLFPNAGADARTGMIVNCRFRI